LLCKRNFSCLRRGRWDCRQFSPKTRNNLNKTKIPFINQHTAHFNSIFSQAIDLTGNLKNRPIVQ